MRTGELVLHYKIMERLGEGGMGVVYKALDSKLNREVAIKFLPHYLSADDEEKRRFEIEAQSAASLNHQNICLIYAIEEYRDEYFIVMEYIEGTDLREKIKSGTIPINEIVNAAIQMAEGFSAAHKKGIVHRDIKSSNIMLTPDGKIKIMDFGLAKIGKGTMITEIGSTIGTIAYMSPEQARGNDVNNRTDIWSFGVLLFEMLTGELPFKGVYDQAVIYAIFNEDPAPPAELRHDVPVELNSLVLKCLKKDPDKRYKDFSEILSELKKYYGFTSVHHEKPQLKRIAILPFINVSGHPQSDYLGFALADQVIGALAYSKDVLVRPSASIRKYTNTFADIKDVGSELNVEYLLSGNFLTIEEQIRLNIEFVEIKTENLLWRESLKVKFKDAFELQDLVSQKVVDGLKLQFSHKEKERINKDIPVNTLAYEYFLKGIAYPNNNEQTLYAIQMLEKSIELDPDYAPSYLELGNRYHYKSCYILGGEKDFSKAVELIKKAISINSEFASALSRLGLLYTEIGKIDESIALLRKSVEIKPNEADSHFALSYAYRYGGELEEARTEAEKAVMLNPKNPGFRSIGATYYYLGEYEEAKKYFDYDRGSDYRNFWYGIVELQLGSLDSALINFKRINSAVIYSLFGRFAHFFVSYIEKDQRQTEEALTALENAGFLDAEDFYWVAVCFALVNNVKGCVKWLTKAIERGFIIYDYMIRERFLVSVKDADSIKVVLEQARIKQREFRKRFFD